MQITKKELQDRFPDLEIFWTWNDVPKGYESKTTLKKLKMWNDGLQPNAVKGNGLSFPYYTFLYKIDLLPDAIDKLKTNAHVLEPNPNRIYEYCSNIIINRRLYYGHKLIIVDYDGVKNDIPCYQIKKLNFDKVSPLMDKDVISGVPQNALKRV